MTTTTISTTDTTLSPCPFCGSADVGIAHPSGKTWVECNDCFAQGPYGPAPAAIWNQRTQAEGPT